MLKKILRKILPNPLFLLLRKAKKKNQKRFLILWNRGLGDIPLGLYALKSKILEALPEAEITFLTREDLYDAFQMLEGTKAIALKSLQRGQKIPLRELIEKAGLKESDFDVCIEKIDTDRWLSWQIGKVVPKLLWKDEYNQLADKFKLEGNNHLGVHVSSETGQFYGYDKNWPKGYFDELFEKLGNQKIILFGLEKDTSFKSSNIIDLRGETSLFEMLSIMKNHCSKFLAPDSGILSFSYYVDVDFPIKMVSLWADPRQGILRQKVPSPNPSYQHCPIVSSTETLTDVSPDRVFEALNYLHSLR